MVTIIVLGHTLREAVGASEINVEVSGPTTIKKLIETHQDRLGGLLPYLARREALITMNKRVGTEDSLVKDGDIVKFAFQSRASYDGTRDIPV
ncbi:MAG: MoaD/ThiS family protein [Nitrospira sp.]|nr:MoaD/ThiS family protein [Nitrospira sp.]MCP9442588.1 MoaD/ThiS family protein [Nitrospira sp.]